MQGRAAVLLLGTLSAAILLDTLSYSTIIPLLPSLAETHGWSPARVGLVVALLPLASLLGTWPVAAAARRLGYPAVLQAGVALLALASLLQAVAGDGRKGEPALLVARLLMGVSGACTWISAMAIVSQAFHDEEEEEKEAGEEMRGEEEAKEAEGDDVQVLLHDDGPHASTATPAAAAAWTPTLSLANGIVMTVNSVGILAGPLFSSLIFHALGFAAVYYVVSLLAALVFIASLFVLKFLHIAPKDDGYAQLDAPAEGEAQEDGGEGAGDVDPVPGPDPPAQGLLVTWKLLLTRRLAVHAFIVCIMEAAAMTLLEPIVPLYLDSQFSSSPLTIGLVFSSVTVAYGLMSPVVSALTPRFGFERVMAGGLIGLGIGLPLIVLAGSVFRSIPLVCLALAVAGASATTAITPSLPAASAVLKAVRVVRRRLSAIPLTDTLLSTCTAR